MKKRILFVVLCGIILISIFSIMFVTTGQSPYIIGDLDRDGEITDWDAVLLARKVHGFQIDLDSDRIADINGDGAIDEKDVELFDKHQANWSLETQIGNQLSFKISYVNTFDATNNNPTTLCYGNEETILSEISREHYKFEGWFVGDKKYTSIPENQNEDLVLTAKWTPVTYSISYGNTKGAQNPNPTTYTIESKAIVLIDLSKDGYTFDGWYSGSKKVTTIAAGSVGNVELVAKWTPITYSATFVCDGTVVTTRYFTIEDSVIQNIPTVPSKAGYIGVWQDYEIVAKNITIYANYSLETYNISYSNLKGATNHNPSTYTTITETFSLLNVQCDGYTFDGWYQGNTKITKIEKGTYGNISLTAKWTPINYDITYSNTKGAVNKNPSAYNIESETIYLKDISADYYTFDGWWANGTRVRSIPTGSIGTIQLEAHWTPISYSITYLNTKGATNKNPVQYTIEEQFLLQELSIDGYTFMGWFIDGEEIEKINVGNYGSKMITAEWKPTEYSISYKNTKGAANPNALKYDIECNTIFLTDISATGYVFDGWTLNGTKTDRIASGSFGDIILEANWTPIPYTLSYNNTKGASNPNPASYTIEDSVTLKDITATGYTFVGWYIDDEKITKINAGSYENKTLTAQWTPTPYSITYTNTYGAENSNVQSYTIESETIVLEDISRDGYDFDGWYCDGEKVTQIAAGSTGKIALTAQWTPITYTVTYSNIYDSETKKTIIITHSNPLDFTIESSFTLTDPVLPTGYVFDGWYQGNTKITKIELGTLGNISLHPEWTFTGKYIKTAADFAAIINDPTGTYSLATSIEIDEKVCDSSNPFQGYFYGNGRWIKGAQPFGEIASGATIDGLSTYMNRDTINSEFNGYPIADVNRGTIINCIGTKGVVADNYGTIQNCAFNYESQLSGSRYSLIQSIEYPKRYGGLVGYNAKGARIISCYVSTHGSLEAESSNKTISIGGLVGYNSGSIKNSYFNSTLLKSTEYDTIGGIAGEVMGGEILCCYAEGALDRIVDRSGGIVGDDFYAGSTGTIKNCFASMDHVYYSISLYADEFYRCYYSAGNYAPRNDYSKACIETADSNFKSPYFIRKNLAWDESVWYLKDGQLPRLQWEVQ